MTRKYRETYAVDIDGRLVTCTNGQISADRDLVSLIRFNVRAETPVRLVEPDGEEFIATLDPNDRLGTLAALMSPAPGRSKVLEAPDEVWSYYDIALGTTTHSLAGAEEEE